MVVPCPRVVWPTGDVGIVKQGLIALFSCTIATPTTATGVPTHFTLPSHEATTGTRSGEWAGGAVELAELESLGRTLVQLGVRLVGCQRVIHPWLQRYLQSFGVITLERLSIRHIGV